MTIQLYGWRDLEMQVTGAASGPAAPTLTAFGSTGVIKQLAFAVNDSVYLAAHVPHDIKVDSTMFPHVHWSSDGTDVNVVRWQLTYVNAKGHQQEAFPADTVLTLDQAGQGTAWYHMISEHVTGFPALEVDSLSILELKRVTNGGVENTDAIYAMFVDFHYECQQYGTLNKAPNFYR
jgi:hypothetical protein